MTWYEEAPQMPAGLPIGSAHAFVGGEGRAFTSDPSSIGEKGGGARPPSPQPLVCLCFASLPGAVSCPDLQCGLRIQVSEKLALELPAWVPLTGVSCRSRGWARGTGAQRGQRGRGAGANASHLLRRACLRSAARGVKDQLDWRREAARSGEKGRRK